MAYLALMHAHGVVVSQDARAAVALYEKAAAGVMEGMVGLSLMFATGRGVTEDVVRALDWQQRAERMRLDP